MKKFDILKTKKLMPKKETVSFLLQFSKSLAILKTKTKKYLISKN
ncbi:hypothetical protein SAMN05443292_2577 [Halpernia frigidisoli]|uniref:Uncharacterized protein n=1 Tax=Halpernia frigidisoli TaxID=1125876 RepID=A0A1I3I6E9_9FLAO|nr:hypothetical protein SAMN05443292_2577 [Halpernia frigidisoli]